MIRRFTIDRRATAATEFVLALPLMVILMVGSMEAGHFFWTQHKLVKAVRDGARYASRMPITDLCNGATTALNTATRDTIRNVTVTGQVAAGGTAKVPGWLPSTVTITVGCQQFVGTGIYTDNGANGPLIKVATGSVAYPSLLGGLGIMNSTVQLSAESSAAVMGI